MPPFSSVQCAPTRAALVFFLLLASALLALAPSYLYAAAAISGAKRAADSAAAAPRTLNPDGDGHATTTLRLERRVAAAPAPSQYSSYECIGGHEYGASAASERSCIFHDVCHINGSGLGLRFYADPDEAQQPVVSEGNAFLYDFPPQFLAAGAYLHSGFSAAWAPELVLAARPAELPFHPALVAVGFQAFVESNFGEWLNVLINVFAQQALHGLQPRPADAVLVDLDSLERAGKFRAAMLASVSAHAPLDLRASGDVCFRNFIVGAGHMSVLGVGRWGALVLQPLRDAILEALALPPPPPPTRHAILVLQKNAISGNSGRHVLNHDAVVAELTAHFAGIATVESVLPDGLTVHEQLRRAQAATVIITPPGGGSFMAFFARPGAALIVLDVQHNGESQRYPQLRGGGSEDATWTQLASMARLHYPVCSPAETDESHTEGNIYVVPQRMNHLAYLAMKRAQRHFPTIGVRDTRRDGIDRFRAPDICDITFESEERWRIDP